MSDKPKIDEFSGVETTGHSWDGIEELNTPLPKWWVWTLMATVVWSLGYVVLMPAIPFPGGDGWSYTKGLLGYSQREIVTRQVEANGRVVFLFPRLSSWPTCTGFGFWRQVMKEPSGAFHV